MCGDRLLQGKDWEENQMEGNQYVGQDIAPTAVPSASRTESYLIISMATAVGLE